MMSHDLAYQTTIRQLGTNEHSSSMLLDPATETRLYRLYRTFFQEAEERRQWNLWTEIPWDHVLQDPTPELAQAVFSVYCQGIFLPDYSARSLHALRASRGRAWFLTRWSYEEGKHLLVMTEWLVRTGVKTDEQLRRFTDEQLTLQRWEPPYFEAPALFWDALLWELHEQQTQTALLDQAQASGDLALTDGLRRILMDETAHYGFLRDALRIIQETYPEKIADAANRIATMHNYPGGEQALLALLA